VEKEEHPMLCSDTNHALAWCCADCNGSKETCSAESLTAQYIRVYGKEHWDALHAMDRPVITFPVSQEGADTERTEQDDQSREGDDGGHSASSASSGTSTATRLQTPRRNRNSVGRRFWTRYQSGEISPVTLFPGPEAPVESKEYLTEIGQSDLTPKMRAILVDWLIELSEHFSFGRETLHLAITMTDRVLASGPFSEDEDQMDGDESCYNAGDYDEMSFTSKCYKIRRSRYQLLGGACTWMACKLMELHAPKVIEFAYVSDGFYDVDQVKSMERRVCNALKFAFFQEPTPYQFLLEFLRASYEGDRLLQHADQCQHSHCGIDPLTTSTFHELANYLLELGRLSFTPVTQKPSLLAAAATYLARVTMNIRSPGQPKPSCDRNGFWTPTLHHYSGYSKQDLKETVLAVHAYQMAAENNTKLKAAFTKYKSRKYKRVALTTVVLQDQLGFDDGN
jgi:cyclin A